MSIGINEQARVHAIQPRCRLKGCCRHSALPQFAVAAVCPLGIGGSGDLGGTNSQGRFVLSTVGLSAPVPARPHRWRPAANRHPQPTPATALHSRDVKCLLVIRRLH